MVGSADQREQWRLAARPTGRDRRGEGTVASIAPCSLPNRLPPLPPHSTAPHPPIHPPTHPPVSRQGSGRVCAKAAYTSSNSAISASACDGGSRGGRCVWGGVEAASVAAGAVALPAEHTEVVPALRCKSSNPPKPPPPPPAQRTLPHSRSSSSEGGQFLRWRSQKAALSVICTCTLIRSLSSATPVVLKERGAGG